MNRFTKYVWMVLVVWAAGCSDSKELDGNSISGTGTGSSGPLRVQTSVQSRSAVDGSTLPRGSAIGAVVTTEDGSAYFTPSVTDGSGSADGGYYSSGRNVRFANDAGENTWTSTTEDGKTKLLLFTGEERGKVYGYYPWTDDANIAGDGAAATIPVGILNEGTIEVDAAGGAAGKPSFTAADDIDYMYSSRSDVVGAKTTTTARFVMEHALSRVSFRMYASSAAQDAVEGDAGSYYEFAGYTLKNRNGSSDLVANWDDNTRMSVSSGEISGTVSGGEIARRIEGYRMVRSAGDDEASNTAAAESSLRVGNLVFPLASLGHADGKSTGIEAVFEVRRMSGDGTVATGSAAYALPLAVVAGESDRWDAGKHYTYTVKFTGSSLSVESVTVTRWNEVSGGDMNIGEDPYVASATITPQGDIIGPGGTYEITLTGLLSVHGTPVRVRSGEETLAEAKAFDSGKAVQLTVPSNTTGATRTVVFEYKLNGEWTAIEERTQKAIAVGDLYGGGVVYWVNPSNASDFRVVAMDQNNGLRWAVSSSYVLGSGAQSETARNGADVWKIAKAYSEAKTNGTTGTFATDFPAFSYCYEKNDGGVSKGTWYLPSLQELTDLHSSTGTLEPIITSNSGRAFSIDDYWCATELPAGMKTYKVTFNKTGHTMGETKTMQKIVRCIRSV